tara:strand:+ start:379 stop:714 length:336 start_codon:yes stop_codon:yes gene_type:complete
MNLKVLPLSVIAATTMLIGSLETASAHHPGICRRNLRDAAKLVAKLNDFELVRVGSSLPTAFHEDAVDSGGVFITGCEGDVVFDRTGLINLRFNVTRVRRQYYLGTAPFDF